MKTNQNFLERSFIKNFKTIGLVLALATALLSGMIGLAGAGTAITTASVGTVVNPTCSLGVSGSPTWSSITSGVLTAQTSSPVVVTNNGNTGAALNIYGADWSAQAGSVGWTSYTVGSSFVSPGTILTTSPVVAVSNLAASGSSDFVFGLLIPKNDGTSGMTQSITFVASC